MNKLKNYLLRLKQFIIRKSLIRKRFYSNSLTLILSAWLGIDARDIRDSIIYTVEYILSGFQGKIPSFHLSTFLFIVIAFIWAWQFTKYLTSEKGEKEQQYNQTLDKIKDIRKAIFRAPNPKIFEEYPKFIDRLYTPYKALLRMKNIEDVEENEREQWIKDTTENLNALLKVTLEITQFFSIDRVSLNSANIMLYYSKAKYESFIAELITKDKILFRDHKDINAFKGVLITAPKCIVHETQEQNNQNEITRNIPEIIIPVLEPVMLNGKKYQTPGAAVAIEIGNYTTNSKQEFLRGIESPTLREAAKLYFKNDGADIESFTCYRIGSKNNPLGVLNIDSSEETILGTDVEYLYTFGALLSPILQMIEINLRDLRTCTMDQFLNTLKN